MTRFHSALITCLIFSFSFLPLKVRMYSDTTDPTEHCTVIGSKLLLPLVTNFDSKLLLDTEMRVATSLTPSVRVLPAEYTVTN